MCLYVIRLKRMEIFQSNMVDIWVTIKEEKCNYNIFE